ncbi:uncharacterized protein G2W53_021314 [Senna tora]|uniref:CCHC-type domain-containing protein n=1 Tax=Senna tora TaxID=362788 RepID=A0A834TJZ2_9FABA|nr:uncharacterized protein G2W53_021314 [Senna tora]
MSSTTAGGLSREEKDQVERSSKKVKVHGEAEEDMIMVTDDKLAGNVPGHDEEMSLSASDGESENEEDSNSDASSEENDGTRGKFARIYVEINLKKQLVPQVEVRGRSYAVEYEGLHLICFHCGRYGHSKDLCLLKKEAAGKDQSQQVDLNTVPSDGGHGVDDGGNVALAPVTSNQQVGNGSDGCFGPWMTMNRSKRGKNHNQFSKRNGSHNGGARVKPGVLERKGVINVPQSRFEVLNAVGEQHEDGMGSGMNEGFIQGWSTDPNEGNKSISIYGKEIVEDRVAWRPSPVQKPHSNVNPTQAQVVASQPNRNQFFNPIFDARRNGIIGPNNVAGLSRDSAIQHLQPNFPPLPSKPKETTNNDAEDANGVLAVANGGRESFDGGTASLCGGDMAKASMASSPVHVDEVAEVSMASGMEVEGPNGAQF